MACSGCAFVARLFSVGFRENKKGPKRPHAHRLNLGGPQPSPAVRLGTTTISSLVVLLLIWPPVLPKGYANHAGAPPKVKGRRHAAHFFHSPPTFALPPARFI